MREADEASAIAKAMADSESSQAQVGDAERNRAATLRFEAVLALKGAMDAHMTLCDALTAVLVDGTGVDVRELFYADDEALVDAMNMIGISHSNIMRWFAAMEGKEPLARLMLDGPPGLESRKSEGSK